MIAPYYFGFNITKHSCFWAFVSNIRHNKKVLTKWKKKYTNSQKILYSVELFGSRLTFFYIIVFSFIIISGFALNKKQISRLHAKPLCTVLDTLQLSIPKEEDIITVLSWILLCWTVRYFEMETLGSDPWFCTSIWLYIFRIYQCY